MKKALTLVLVICFLSTAAGAGYLYLARDSKTSGKPEKVQIAHNSEEDYEEASALIKNGKPLKAIQIIKKYRPAIEKRTVNGAKWLDLLIKASVEIPDVKQLLILFQYRPSAFESNEKASLIVAETNLLNGKMGQFHKIRDMWKGRETKKSGWLEIDADFLIFSGKNEEAIELLTRHEFEGKEDISRLLQLSLLNMAENPKRAWNYLIDASDKDPNNSTIIAYRSRLLEAMNQVPQALSELITATSLDSSNIALRDKLGEFFLRYQFYRQAEQVYEEAITNLQPTGAIYLKAAFLGKVIQPLDKNSKRELIPEGNSKQLVSYILNLAQDEFWDERVFSTLPNREKYLETEQVTWWLRILSALKENELDKAGDLLESNRFEETAWSPEVSLALKRILNYKKNKTLSLENSFFKVTELEKKSEQADSEWQKDFFRQLNELAEKQRVNIRAAIPANLEKLLNSPLAFSAVFLASGWDEAALALQPHQIIPNNFPEWVSYSFTQAIKNNQGERNALNYAVKQNKTPLIRLAIGEIMVNQNNKRTAIAQLEPLAKNKDEVGMRASWLLSLVYLNDGQYKSAKRIVEQNKEFAKSTLGIESSARIALLEGNISAANRFYKSIEGSSAEAKSFLSRQAFQEKNWERAKRLTIELLKEYPSSPVLRKNVLLILEGQQSDLGRNKLMKF